jgi:DNA-binding NtrC family response regulator
MARNTSGSLLVVDDDRYIQAAMADYLRSLGHRTETASTCNEAIERMEEFPFEVVVCDVNLPDKDGFQLLQWARENSPETSIILLTGFGTIESAVEAIRMGAFDYLTKPVIDEELRFSIERAIGQRSIIEENKKLKAQLTQRFGLSSIIGKDYKMLRMFELIESVADTRTTVLILGESGTGKTMTARSVHQLSNRRDKPFVEVACGAFRKLCWKANCSDTWPGHSPGLHTIRSVSSCRLTVARCSLTKLQRPLPSLQVKLLRVLQDREFEPVGGNVTHKVDVRLVLATNENLEECVKKGTFREDLYYRINVITLTQPPLRDRIGDIPLLAEHYLQMFNEQTGRKLSGHRRNGHAGSAALSLAG